jgi:hypothetical protein
MCCVEGDLVAEMVAARRRMQRLRLIETALIDNEMQRDANGGPRANPRPPRR